MRVSGTAALAFALLAVIFIIIGGEQSKEKKRALALAAVLTALVGVGEIAIWAGWC